jgi:site-specific DNA-methyltransferase (adenine-specific)
MTIKASFSLKGRNPDVLTCIANLSSDEVFTPPEIACRMLDTLAEAWSASNSGANIWEDKNVRFLDPCTKSGVFLREIAKRLNEGLKQQIPDLQQRIDHILLNQVFGIGLTNLTGFLARRSLYCSRSANGKHSIARGFNSSSGNVWYSETKHSWVGDRCSYCGAGKSVFNREARLETYAYAFIHTEDPQKLLNSIFKKQMQFDVIIGNPPYQIGSDGGTRDIPIYHNFVEQAKKLQPKFLSMIIPARWMATGLGLGEFRQTMLSDKRIARLVDFPDSTEVFPGVDIMAGVCYFLWDAGHRGDCDVTTVRVGEVIGPVVRRLDEHDVLVRDARSVVILNKVLSHKENPINSILARDKEFGWTSNFDGFREKANRGDVPLYYIRKVKRGVGYIARTSVFKSEQLIDTWKLLVPAAHGGDSLPNPVLGKPIMAPSPSVCTQSYLFFHAASKKEIESIRSYYATRFFRFLVSLRKLTQHATHSTYCWVPMQSWDNVWTDRELYAKYGITQAEQKFIESCIAEMNLEVATDE